MLPSYITGGFNLLHLASWRTNTSLHLQENNTVSVASLSAQSKQAAAAVFGFLLLEVICWRQVSAVSSVSMRNSFRSCIYRVKLAQKDFSRCYNTIQSWLRKYFVRRENNNQHFSNIFVTNTNCEEFVFIKYKLVCAT